MPTYVTDYHLKMTADDVVCPSLARSCGRPRFTNSAGATFRTQRETGLEHVEGLNDTRFWYYTARLLTPVI